nr:immunoglobulin heavy chain junction region [Macaca mulatta]MOW45923.1 immunoglobulin heavy chain junction region [Macaca mulatta]MOW46034.1 immunoglobulin heavy chain junction region [Macaca mulatta]MOW46295.1 immunoglobulin heavy chain junction region [Macaca mulatta]MOW46574.1 immunoglobulin heavy chain junction region [Macaca mulatta]
CARDLGSAWSPDRFDVW